MRQVLACLALATMLVGCAIAPSQQELASADYGSYPSDYEQVIKSFMQSVLKDPESARYQFLNAPKPGWNALGSKKYGFVVCANINAKNSYGGYVGNRMSYFMIKNGRVIDASHGDGSYGDALVQGMCTKFI